MERATRSASKEAVRWTLYGVLESGIGVGLSHASGDLAKASATNSVPSCLFSEASNEALGTRYMTSRVLPSRWSRVAGGCETTQTRPARAGEGKTGCDTVPPPRSWHVKDDPRSSTEAPRSTDDAPSCHPHVISKRCFLHRSGTYRIVHCTSTRREEGREIGWAGEQLPRRAGQGEGGRQMSARLLTTLNMR